MSNRIRNSFGGDATCVCLADPEVVEVPLLLPTWQVAALATAAQDRGQTTGQMLRSVLRDFIDGLDAHPARSSR